MTGSHIPNGTNLPTWITEYIPSDLVTSTLFIFRVKLQTQDIVDDARVNKQITVNVLNGLDIDYEHLETQMVEMPAMYCFWAAIYSELKTGVAIAERKLKARKGSVTKKILDEFHERQVKPTGEQIKTIIEADPETVRYDMALQTAQQNCGKIYHMLEALKMKTDMLRSLAGFKKQERDNF